MTASAERRGISEGAAVAIASVALVAGLAGVMTWRVRSAEREAPPASGRDDEVSPASADAGAGATDLHEEVAMLKAQLRAAEAARVEAEAAAQAQLARVRSLSEEKNALQARVAELMRTPATRREPVDTRTASAEPAPAPPPAALPVATADGHSVSAKVLHNLHIVDANQDLEYVVLDAGKQDGVREGMVLIVMDGDQVVARLRAADVRDDVTGATVDSLSGDRYPRPSDRVILRQYSDK